MKIRELTLIVMFSALWVTLELSLGHIIGRISIGPISFHGVINRMVGWLLMTVLAEQVRGFGKITLMTVIASIITRVQRVSILEGLIVALGYILAGFIFDILVNIKRNRGLRYYNIIGIITGFMATLPYWISRIYILGFVGFVLSFPVYAYSAIKGLFFSVIGVNVGVTLNQILVKYKFK
jgi:hypothetical protein